MSRIAELADDFDGSLKLDGASQIEADDVAFFNERDFDRLAKKGAEKLETDTRNFEERVRDFSKTPLFMNNLDDAADAGTQNVSDCQFTSQMLRSMCRWRESRTGCYSGTTI